MPREISVGDVEICWLGHAGFMLKSGNAVVYIDPYKVSHGEKADMILVTHEHYDHCDPGSVSVLSGKGTLVVAPKSCRGKLSKFREIKIGDSVIEQGIKVMVVDAYNKEKQFHPRGSGVGYLVTMGETVIYHAGDTDRIPEMSELGHVNVALLPVGGTYTMDVQEAAMAAEAVGAEITIPMHWGTVVGTQSDAERLKKLCKTRVEVLS